MKQLMTLNKTHHMYGSTLIQIRISGSIATNAILHRTLTSRRMQIRRNIGKHTPGHRMTRDNHARAGTSSFMN